jgi:hypothetical protein
MQQKIYTIALGLVAMLFRRRAANMESGKKVRLRIALFYELLNGSRKLRPIRSVHFVETLKASLPLYPRAFCEKRDESSPKPSGPHPTPTPPTNNTTTAITPSPAFPIIIPKNPNSRGPSKARIRCSNSQLDSTRNAHT